MAVQRHVDAGERASGAAELGILIGGRFRIEQVIGRGGMGTVYRVHDQRSGAKLALKRLRIVDERRRALSTSLFEREFHTLAELAHPRIVAVHDYGIDEHGAYYTMELLDGADLRERGKVPWREACALLRDVASSLAILHSRRLLHRDLSPRNVRLTTDGRLKLLDFGAMMPMGTPRTVVGTPPFVPPEALQQQALDARADLYGLGALAYFMLTGRHAYAARSLEELRDLWRSAPPAPRTLEPSVPDSLSRLVMELLCVDRNARPARSAEIMERLCALAGLPPDEHPEVTQAYLTTPLLVGREPELLQVRELLTGLTFGRGATLLLEGEPGSGRTRLLDACVLEAKLHGATVLRADASDGGDYGVARALGRQLIALLPELAQQSARPRRALLSQILEELSDGPAPQKPAWGGRVAAGDPTDTPGPSGKPAAALERRHVQTALRDWLLAVAREKRLVLAVDDLEHVDEPSAALLAALSHGAERRSLLLALTAENAASSPVLSVLRRVSRRIALAPLEAGQSERLVRSLFGDVDNVVLVARRIHELSQGNPRAALETAQHLVDRKIARYHGGAWALPRELAPADLPVTVSAALAARFAGLPEDARDLAEALSLADPSLLSLEHYPALTAHGDHARTYRALDELTAARVLAGAEQSYRFTQGGWAQLIGARLSAERKRELHARLADLTERSDDTTQHLLHRMAAGHGARAIELLIADNGLYEYDYSTATLSFMEQAVAEAAALGLPVVERVRLQIWVVGMSALLGDYPCFSRHAPLLLAQLERDSGLTDLQALGDAIAPGERLTSAFARAQQRYESTPEPQRGLAPLEAVRQLARLCATYAGIAPVAQRAELLEQLPSLEPLAPLSPALGAVEQLVEGIRHYLAGRLEEARATYTGLLARLLELDRAGDGEIYYQAMRFGMLYMIGSLETVLGLPTAHERVAELESVPGHRVNAWRVHRMAHLMQGEPEAARRCQRFAELFQLQDGQRQRYPGTGLAVEVLVCALCDDLTGMKAASERLTEMTARLAGWRPLAHVARSEYRRMQGDAEGALQELVPVLSELIPGRDGNWAWVAAAHLKALLALGRDEEAARRGLEYHAICRRERLSPSDRMLAPPLIQALVSARRTSEARELADACIAEATEGGVRGLALGALYEARARVAIALGDRPAFLRAAERCTQEYKCSENGLLRAKYERLVQAAVSAGFALSPALQPVAEASPGSEARELDLTARSILSRLPECIDVAERARYALSVLLDSTAARAGHLYVLRAGRLARLCSLPDDESVEDLTSMLESYLEDELRKEEATVALGPSELRSSAATAGVTAEQTGAAWTDVRGHRFVPLLLTTSHEGERVIAAVVALRIDSERRDLPGRTVLATLASALLKNGDVDPITCLA